MEMKWNDGINGYREYTYVVDPLTQKHKFNTTLIDAPINPYESIIDCYADLLSVRQTKYVEVLYSGGLDSELALTICLLNNIPVRAITMRLLVNNYPINIVDLYYSEKFCRENSVKQIIIDLDAGDFFEQGKHYSYLLPYKITEPHVATHFWLFEQCSGFPIMGGEYSWPWSYDKPVLSPHRYQYSCYDKFLKNNNISGIGNIMNHSLSGNLIFIKNHLETRVNTNLKTDSKNIPLFKRALWKNLGIKVPECRMRSYGWDQVPTSLINLLGYQVELLKQFGVTHSSITWGNSVNSILNGNITFNDKYA